VTGILVLNAGSSSIKFQLYDVDGEALDRRIKGQIDGIGTEHPRLRAWDGADALIAEQRIDPARAGDVEDAQAVLGGWLVEHSEEPPSAVGHRVVHGGPDLLAPARVDDALLNRLQALVPLAPLHQPNNLAPIRSIRARRPELPQVACFDTAFHRGHAPVVERFALPEALYAQGIRRYGFHGLSYEFLATRMPEAAPEIAAGRVVALHLGSGASACAMVGGRSVDSTMGFTALDGLPMGTRPGQLDPGVVLYLMEQGLAPAEIEHLLYHESGLKGLSGLSGDMRDLLGSDSASARLAVGLLRASRSGGHCRAGQQHGGAGRDRLHRRRGGKRRAGQGHHLPPLRLAGRGAGCGGQ
jgi:acetate kinase